MTTGNPGSFSRSLRASAALFAETTSTCFLNDAARLFSTRGSSSTQRIRGRPRTEVWPDPVDELTLGAAPLAAGRPDILMRPTEGERTAEERIQLIPASACNFPARGRR